MCERQSGAMIASAAAKRPWETADDNGRHCSCSKDDFGRSQLGLADSDHAHDYLPLLTNSLRSPLTHKEGLSLKVQVYFRSRHRRRNRRRRRCLRNRAPSRILLLAKSASMYQLVWIIVCSLEHVLL
jgi:hypothetical protein